MSCSLPAETGPNPLMTAERAKEWPWKRLSPRARKRLKNGLRFPDSLDDPLHCVFVLEGR
ncbi:hypothetical protein CfE428DRAFT_0065 [Chthoniobacter flavus Ellin428]|uniref:Uncharacterized protein n=1 Tax=Chthoniobacter flavus Ellin428 TaxID=497964 RepID=B4CTP4_9BACT|nr:hypothetical protein CfE428DRAFT_0065 [Chthoniobacter flavus Ellin428]